MSTTETKDAPPLLGIEFNHEAWRSALPKDMPRRRLAAALGTTDSNLISIEKGLSNPSIELAMRYCYLTGLPIQELCLKR